jgi:hypothetical protein
MAEIGLDYRDLYLIHAPWPWDEVGKDCREENRQIWKAMEEFLASGRVKAIGVSNSGPRTWRASCRRARSPWSTRSAGSSDSTRQTRFKSVPSTTSSSRPTPRSRTASSSTIPRSATSRALRRQRTPAVHPLPAAEGCRGAAQGDHDPAHQAERRTRLRDFCRRHGRPRRHAGATPRGTRTRWSSAGSDRSLGSSRRSATAREVLAIDQARDDRRGRSRRPRLRPVRLWSLERIPFESRMCCPLGRTQRGTDCRRDAAARDSSSARRHRCTGRLVPESSRPPRRAR